MVFLDSLVQDMNRNKTGLDEVNMRKVNPSKLGPNEIRGAIAEQLVRQWIQKCPETDFFADLPLKVNGYEARHMPSGIVIFEGSITKLEYDFVVKYHNAIALIEVKSLGLNGVEGKIEKALSIGRELFPQTEVGFLLCFPAYCNRVVDVQRIEQAHPNARCLDLGYKKKNLTQAYSRFCELQDS